MEAEARIQPVNFLTHPVQANQWQPIVSFWEEKTKI